MKTPDVINTFTGKSFAPLNPVIEDIDIRDIAQALSNMCRFTGHVSEFYSVAEHSCYVHDILAHRIMRGHFDQKSLGNRTGQPLTEPAILHMLRWALLHDAAEAYLIDVARPVKRQPQMQFYRDAENKLLTCIARRFGMAGDAPPSVVEDVDREICKNEARRLLPNMRADLWPDDRPILDEAEFETVVEVIGRTPRVARAMFLDRFRKLFPDVVF